MEQVKEISIKEPSIELCKLLKLGDLVNSGGQAKALIVEGRVRVNGVVETRKGKQIVSGDVVECAGKKISVTTSPRSPDTKSQVG